MLFNVELPTFGILILIHILQFQENSVLLESALFSWIKSNSHFCFMSEPCYFALFSFEYGMSSCENHLISLFFAFPPFFCFVLLFKCIPKICFLPIKNDLHVSRRVIVLLSYLHLMKICSIKINKYIANGNSFYHYVWWIS